jgi:hypothetical protein
VKKRSFTDDLCSKVRATGTREREREREREINNSIVYDTSLIIAKLVAIKQVNTSNVYMQSVLKWINCGACE